MHTLAMIAPSASSTARPRAARADGRAVRLRHITAAFRRLVLAEPLRRVARRFRVSVRTIQLWVERALTYHDPEAQALRNLAGRAA